MSETELMFSKKEVQRAGETLLIKDVDKKDPEAYTHAMKVLSNWRSCHEYPLHKVANDLQSIVQNIDKQAFVVRRLKRTPSIITKLIRFNQMKLRNMQDIGGCRAVMTSKNNVYRAARRLNKNNDYKVTDYIKNPKEDGYRGIHLIKKFPGPKGHGDYPVEIQIRTKVLHSWATAVEIIDLFTNQTLKSNNGKKEWVDFFKSVSNEFNELDKTSIDSTSNSLSTSYKLTRKLGVLKRFAAYSQSLKLLDLAKEEDFDRYFLIKVDLNGKTVSIETYNTSHFKYATDKFLIEEKLSALSGRYVVALVSSKSVDDLREAYPNYFADSSDFINNLRTVCAKYEYNNPTLSRRFKSRVVRFMGDLTIFDK